MKHFLSIVGITLIAGLFQMPLTHAANPLLQNVTTTPTPFYTPKVTKSALQNASSIASLMLTTEALISEIKEKDKAPAMPGGGGGMGGMY